MTTVMWTVNHRDEFIELKELYGDNLMGVMTDNPSRLAKFCRDIEQGPPPNRLRADKEEVLLIILNTAADNLKLK